jgi:hypothetical protein
MSVGLIDDDAVVAWSGVTACDHAIKAAKAIPIPIVPVERNSLHMAASFLFVDAAMMKQSRFSTLPSPRKNDVVLGKFVSSQDKCRALMKQSHRSVSQMAR